MFFALLFLLFEIHILFSKRPHLISALLMAARLHEFNRSARDIVKIVKVHESTLRKRYVTFSL